MVISLVIVVAGVVAVVANGNDGDGCSHNNNYGSVGGGGIKKLCKREVRERGRFSLSCPVCS